MIIAEIRLFVQLFYSIQIVLQIFSSFYLFFNKIIIQSNFFVFVLLIYFNFIAFTCLSHRCFPIHVINFDRLQCSQDFSKIYLFKMNTFDNFQSKQSTHFVTVDIFQNTHKKLGTIKCETQIRLFLGMVFNSPPY